MLTNLGPLLPEAERDASVTPDQLAVPDDPSALGRWMNRQITGTRVDLLAGRVTELWAARMDASTDAVVLGRYELDHVLGRGSHGVVFGAFDRALEREVAVKVLGAATERDAIHEARALARVDHPNVVALHDIGRDGGFSYLVMTPVDGWTMSERMRAGLGWCAVVELFMQIGRGLAAVHRAGFVHGDVKPANMLVGRNGRAYLADFGLARPRGWREHGKPGGTREYMAPERSAGENTDPCSDQYSFCVALWEALYGSRPWGSSVVSPAERLPVEPARLRTFGDVVPALDQFEPCASARALVQDARPLL